MVPLLHAAEFPSKDESQTAAGRTSSTEQKPAAVFCAEEGAQMKDYRACALTQAAAMVGAAAGVSQSQACRLTGGWCGSPEAFLLAAQENRPPEQVAKALAHKMKLTGSWFDQVAVNGGYLNFRLAQEWYTAVATEPVGSGPEWRGTVPAPPEFPAAIDPGDWRFLWRSGGERTPTPSLAARQDQGNPAWLVRYTGRRMSTLAAREGAAIPESWSEEDHVLLRMGAEYASQRMAQAPVLGRYLTELAHGLWKHRRGSWAAKRSCAAVLTAGYDQLAGKGSG